MSNIKQFQTLSPIMIYRLLSTITQVSIKTNSEITSESWISLRVVSAAQSVNRSTLKPFRLEHAREEDV